MNRIPGLRESQVSPGRRRNTRPCTWLRYWSLSLYPFTTPPRFPRTRRINETRCAATTRDPARNRVLHDSTLLEFARALELSIPLFVTFVTPHGRKLHRRSDPTGTLRPHRESGYDGAGLDKLHACVYKVEILRAVLDISVFDIHLLFQLRYLSSPEPLPSRNTTDRTNMVKNRIILGRTSPLIPSLKLQAHLPQS